MAISIPSKNTIQSTILSSIEHITNRVWCTRSYYYYYYDDLEVEGGGREVCTSMTNCKMATYFLSVVRSSRAILSLLSTNLL